MVTIGNILEKLNEHLMMMCRMAMCCLLGMGGPPL
jgi:hypothetical protein